MTDRLTAVDAGFSALLAHAGERVSLTRTGLPIANLTAVVTAETWTETTSSGGYVSSHGARLDLNESDWPFGDKPQKMDGLTWRGDNYQSFAPGGDRFWQAEEGVLSVFFVRV